MKRYALFVGVNNYADSTIQNLNYPSEDATELASVFRRLLKFNRVEKLINPKHSPEIVDAVKDMTRGLGAGDLFLFFFAGHGFRVKENHVLVCAKDEFVDLEDEYAGLSVGRLKKRMRGPWNRMLVLDACQNDIRATRGADTSATERDLALIHETEATSSESGYQIVLTACSEGQKALEVSDLGHGLFTSAFLDSVTSFADARRRLDLEALRADLGKRMGGLIAQYHLSGRQEPLFTMPTDASGIVLLDGDAAFPHLLVACPICGKKNDSRETFECHECGRDNLCLRHQDDKTFFCVDCISKKQETELWFKKGEDFFHGSNGCREDHAEAVNWYRKAAERGLAAAQDKLGWMYENGWGTRRDYAQAAAWYRKAAEQGNDLAQNSFGRMYENGWGVPQSNELAVAWYRKAADMGNKDACHKYGDILFHGRLGMDKNVAVALTYYQKADLSNPWIQYDIGECHLHFYMETGKEEDARSAVEWLQKSANAGVPWACVKMGDCYRDGIGVSRDLVCARDWYSRTADPDGVRKFGDFEATYWAKRCLADLSKAWESGAT